MQLNFPGLTRPDDDLAADRFCFKNARRAVRESVTAVTDIGHLPVIRVLNGTHI